MPDLHGWITQQITTAERIVREGADHSRTAAVLRRCEADRRILNRHRLNPDAHWYDAGACHGCGTYGYDDTPNTENLNDCPELLDLAHAHGITPEILASLDEPETLVRPQPRARRIGPPAQPTSSVPPALRGPNWKAD